jgi:uncharacterized membrane protein (GlpM family)
MQDIFLQIATPFILSALIVIIITLIAEKYGTKVGGIIGTLPTTIIIAFIFIALNKGVNFASESVSIVPAEMGINLVFLFIFAFLAYKKFLAAIIGSFIFWAVFSTILFFSNLHNIYISFFLYIISMVTTFIILEKIKKINSIGKRKVHYTPKKIFFRGVLTGTIIAISVFLSNINPQLSGIFTVFPAILSSTMIISYREHGPDFSAGMAKSIIFGSPSVMSYAVSIHFFYPSNGIIFGSIISFFISFIITLIILKLRNNIR